MSSKIGPSHIKTISRGGSIDIGEVGAEISPRIRDVYELIKSAGIYITMNDDFLKAQWEKMVLISSIRSLDSVTRTTYGELLEIPKTRAMLKQSMIEVIDVANALNVNIEYDFADKMIAFVDGLPADSTSSLHRDIRDGTQSELDYLIGSVVKHGIEQGVDIPLSKFLYYSLLPQELASRN